MVPSSVLPPFSLLTKVAAAASLAFTALMMLCDRCKETDPPIDYVEASAKEAINVDQAFHTLAQKALTKGKHTAARCVPSPACPKPKLAVCLCLTPSAAGERTWMTSFQGRTSSWT
jgi:hypothetical protein